MAMMAATSMGKRQYPSKHTDCSRHIYEAHIVRGAAYVTMLLSDTWLERLAKKQRLQCQRHLSPRRPGVLANFRQAAVTGYRVYLEEADIAAQEDHVDGQHDGAERNDGEHRLRTAGWLRMEWDPPQAVLCSY